MKLSKLLFFVIFCIIIIAPAFLDAQCAMCKAQAEQSVEQGSTAARWINGGIFYMLFFPYIAFAFLFWKWYKGYKMEKKY